MFRQSPPNAGSRKLGSCRAFLRFALVIICFTGGAAEAGSLSISPLRLTFVPGKSIIAVNVENTGSETALVQADVFAWSQQSSDEVLLPSDDIVAVPPVFKLEAGAKQIIRVGLTRPFQDKQEVSFRLIVTEVPTNIVPGTVAVSVRHSIPAFVMPSVPSKATISIKGEDAGRWIIANTGNAHLRINRWSMRDVNGKVIAEANGPGYLLPGTQRTLHVPQIDSALAASFDLDSDAGKQQIRAVR